MLAAAEPGVKLQPASQQREREEARREQEWSVQLPAAAHCWRGA